LPCYKSAYELGLDALDLQLCHDTDYNQPNYVGSRSIDDEQDDKASPTTDSPIS
jgi:hypothetical protein